MPPFTATLPPYSLFGRDNNTLDASNTTGAQHVTEVVCAWAVSGQYGFGTRLLYYILVALSVLARRKEWLKNASLAAALLLPAVAAIHAIVLAAVHVDNAVDMDIYGAFQICSIGILAAPITAYNSKTYFNDPGRNIIFVWTGLLLAGMLSLTVEFFRTETHSCSLAAGPFDASVFPSVFASCDSLCGESGGPTSPIRQDPTNQAAVIPVPERLTFGTVTLLAAGSSIPPVLTLIFTWEKILEINWKRRFGQGVPRQDDPIEGTNGATPRIVTAINGAIWKFLSTIQIPIFSAIVIILLVFGEINFWSPQVTYQTEPFTSVGQWANVVATILVVLGSLFYVQNERKIYGKEYAGSNHSRDTQNERYRESMHSSIRMGSPRMPHGPVMDRNDVYNESDEDQRLEEQREYMELGTVTTNRTSGPTAPSIFNNQHRNSVASWLNRFADYIGTAAPDRYDNSVFREGQSEFPEIPGEAGRVADFEEIRARYKSSRQQEDGASIYSSSSFRNAESGPANRGISPSRSPRPVSRSNTTPVGQTEYSALELNRTPTSPSQFTAPSLRPRRDTLEVPEPPRPAHIRPRNSSASPMPSPSMIIDTQGSPKIVISTEPEDASPTTSPIDGPSLGPR
ncbi:hypothetical protein O1611_g1208 [Lasiodiplodia mahajangana]|uniref:Uncharacterized protein n=1 Tax=Lasiodiplodia mahajangana TaxID=1108764 RepID=A0ACC2JY47_9PEZI|nr:hypothetical protein O1611_g1208 [Lasiodiplodia mahajangana]